MSTMGGPCQSETINWGQSKGMPSLEVSRFKSEKVRTNVLSGSLVIVSDRSSSTSISTISYSLETRESHSYSLELVSIQSLSHISDGSEVSGVADVSIFLEALTSSVKSTLVLGAPILMGLNNIPKPFGHLDNDKGSFIPLLFNSSPLCPSQPLSCIILKPFPYCSIGICLGEMTSSSYLYSHEVTSSSLIASLLSSPIFKKWLDEGYEQ